MAEPDCIQTQAEAKAAGKDTYYSESMQIQAGTEQVWRCSHIAQTTSSSKRLSIAPSSECSITKIRLTLGWAAKVGMECCSLKPGRDDATHLFERRISSHVPCKCPSNAGNWHHIPQRQPCKAAWGQEYMARKRVVSVLQQSVRCQSRYSLCPRRPATCRRSIAQQSWRSKIRSRSFVPHTGHIGGLVYFGRWWHFHFLG